MADLVAFANTSALDPVTQAAVPHAQFEAISEAAADLISRSESLLEAWRVRLGGVRADAAARRIVEALAEHPVLSAAVVAERLGVSVRAGQAALAVLADHGIVQRYRPRDAGTGGPGRPTGYWVASELIALVAGWTAG
jgi:predicted ArsR family transcriptional regulator